MRLLGIMTGWRSVGGGVEAKSFAAGNNMITGGCMKLLITIIFCFTITGCSTWNTNKNLFVVSNVVTSVHWFQQRAESQRLGRDKDKDDQLFASAMAFNLVMYFLLPEKVQQYWFTGVSVLQVPLMARHVVDGDGINMGIGVKGY